MSPLRLRWMFLAASVAVGFTVSPHLLHADQAAGASGGAAGQAGGTAVQANGQGQAGAPRPNYDPPANLARTDLPGWPYPKGGVYGPKTEETGALLHVPGSTKGYTYSEINSGAPDWFPDSHPVAPAPVLVGRRGAYQPCGQCHLADGRGKPDTADLRGLPVAYMMQQVEDLKNDKRHASVVKAPITTMISVAKGVTPDEVRQAAEYFHSMKWTRAAEIIETDTVPVTHPGPHAVQFPDPTEREPIGMRIIEVPVDVELTELRDPNSGFIAYVPKGSVAKGKALVETGGGKTVACGTCHGKDLKGMGDQFPPLAGHSPSATARQLYDIRSGTRDGQGAALMKPVVANLNDEDILDLSAYIGSLQP